jgi:hypothetical protein
MNVTIWKPMPGKSAQMIEHALAAKAIQEKLGASITIGMENTGRMHYALGGFENWQAWAAFVAKLEANADWAAWQQRTGPNPAALQEENFLLNALPGGNDGGSVYQVFIWQPRDGRISDVIETASQAKVIHEKAGARVSIIVDQLNRMHYVMNYDDLNHWAKLRDTPNPEFTEFWDQQTADPNADLVEVYTASRLQD